MKKLLLGMMAVSLMFATSCQNEEIADGGKLATVSFSVGTPEITSRAYSDGMTATVLQYAVYDEEGKILPALTVDNAEINGSTTVNLQLTTGNTYSVIFWAAAQGAPYTVDFATQTMTVDYTNAVSNDENRDAFYKYHTFTVTGAQTETIELKRPFAQLNIGTADYAASAKAGYTPTQSAVTVKNIYNTLDLVEGEVSGETEVAFGLADIKKDESFPVSGNEYLAMNYLLVGNDKETVDVEFTYADANNVAKPRTVGSVPVQRNYRTNIYGQLLTSDVDVNVEIKPGYEKPDYEVLIWDGSEVKEPKVSGTNNNIYEIEYASELAWLAAAVNGTLTEGQRSAIAPNSFAGKTFVLTEDIDLGGHEWTPIGYGKNFEGSFDGQGYTISNFKITTKRNKSIHQAALFGAIAGNSTFKNFTVDNAQVLYPGVEAGDFYGAAVVGTVYGNHTFEDIKVTNSKIQGNNKVAGLIAHDGSSSSITIKDCHVERCSIETKNSEDGGNVGGMVGYLATNGTVISNSSVKNCTINAINSSDEGKRANSQFIGAIHGGRTLTIVNCVVENNNYTETGLETYVSPYDVNFIGGARYEPTAEVIINDTRNLSILPESITLDETSTIVLKSLEADHGVTLSGKGTLILDGVTITAASGSAITLAEGADVTLQIRNIVSLTGATNGIEVAEGRTLNVQGEGKLTTIGNAGSGIGSKGANAGTITIEIANITAKGNGDHAFGIGGNGANVVIKNSTVDYACGGHIQPLFVNDTKYGKSEPEGGAGIGGATIQIEGSTITKVDGGSKAAAIGAQYWQSTNIAIKNSTILEANGGNASAGIGGSRYAGDSKYDLTIQIEKSTITATGGQGGAGIGSGYDTHCNGQEHTATNKIVIDGASTITATGGKYAAGIGTGFHSAYLSGSIAEGATIYAESGEKFYKDAYSEAQNIGYGVVDPAREFSGDNRNVTFTVNGTVIAKPVEVPVAKVGDTPYNSIDEAIANWTNNTILTLIDNVTLSDVITLKSTEYHVLDLGKFTMTAAKGKDAITITAEGRSNASYALDIKADATNPGGITATSKAVVKTTGKSGVKDRPIIRFYNGVFNASNIISHSGSNGTNCPQFQFHGGVYNGTISANRALIQFYGGTFNGSLWISVDSSAYALISGGKFKELKNNYMSALNSDKFTIGSAKGAFDRGVYVDDEGYFVVGGPVITEFGDKFAAKATNASKVGSYLPYSSAAANGLYYTNAQMAIENHGAANVELKE